MESRDKPLPTERNETPDWEEEIVAENKDTARVDIDSGPGMEKDASEQRKKKKMEGEKERKEVTAAKEKVKANKPKAVATTTEVRAGAGGAPAGSNEYILEGFDFSTGTIIFCTLEQETDDNSTIYLCLCLGHDRMQLWGMHIKKKKFGQPPFSIVWQSPQSSGFVGDVMVDLWPVPKNAAQHKKKKTLCPVSLTETVQFVLFKLGYSK